MRKRSTARVRLLVFVSFFLPVTDKVD